MRKSKFEQGLKKLGDGLLKIGKRAIKLGAIMTGLGVSIGVALSRPALVAAEFSDQMLTVQGVTRATGAEFNKLEAEAKRLGRTTSFTAAEVAAAMVELGRAGFAPQAILDSTEAVLNLSRSTATELPQAAEIAAAALRQFELATEDSARVADVLSAGANRSAQTLTDLFEALKPVGPLAKEAGSSIEQTVAAIGLLANVGIKGSLAGSSLARAYKNLSSELKQGQLQKLTGGLVSAVDQNGNLRQLGDILTDLADATASFPTAKRLATFETLFGRGQVAALKLANAGPELAKFADDLRNVEGEAKRVADVMDSGLGGSIRKLLSAVEGIAIAFGSAMTPELQIAGTVLADLAGKVTEFVEKNRALVVSVLLTAAGLIAGGVALTSFGVAASLLGVGIQKLSATFTFFRTTVLATLRVIPAVLSLVRVSLLGLLGPFAVIPVAVGLAAAAFFAFSDTGKRVLSGFVSNVTALFDRLRESFSRIAKALSEGNFTKAFAIVRLTAIAEMKRLIFWIVANFNGTIVFFQQVWTSIRDTAVSAWKSVSGFVVGLWGQVTNFIGSAFVKAANALNGPLGVLQENFGGVVGKMTSSWGEFVFGFRIAWIEAQRLIGKGFFFLLEKMNDFAIASAKAFKILEKIPGFSELGADFDSLIESLEGSTLAKDGRKILNEDLDQRAKEAATALAESKTQEQDLLKANLKKAREDFLDAKAELNQGFTDIDKSTADFKLKKVDDLKNPKLLEKAGSGFASKIKKGADSVEKSFGTFNARGAANALANFRTSETVEQRQLGLLADIKNVLEANKDANLKVVDALQQLGVA